MGLCIGASFLTVAEIGELIVFKLQVLYRWFRGKRADKHPKRRSDVHGIDRIQDSVELKAKTNCSAATVEPVVA
jgi:hypothetical protein